MPYLVKNIKGELLDNIEGTAQMVSKLISEIGTEDYISVNTFVAFTQNFSQVIKSEEFPSIIEYGLRNNTQFIELKINY